MALIKIDGKKIFVCDCPDHLAACKGLCGSFATADDCGECNGLVCP